MWNCVVFKSENPHSVAKNGGSKKAIHTDEIDQMQKHVGLFARSICEHVWEMPEELEKEIA